LYNAKPPQQIFSRGDELVSCSITLPVDVGVQQLTSFQRHESSFMLAEKLM
jgi:hypothetical protein